MSELKDDLAALRLSREPETARRGRRWIARAILLLLLVLAGFVMAVTGLALWFPVVVNEFLPFWVVKVSEVIHLFEAWLATMAVLIFHFFFVIGHPEVYPMSLSMFTGNMSEEDARHHHPEWAESERNEEGKQIR